MHFENESHREDGQKKLKSNAIPTLFNIPNPPPMIDPPPRHSTYKQKNVEPAKQNAVITAGYEFWFRRRVEQNAASDNMINGVENKTINAASPGFQRVDELYLY
ncbi:hypothetical protein NQ314_018949 [Rhamnusium bicolor]|uniref:Uncharacterized protein n=1 Tax=Rhamnusium bicolor TaxID=1586634 RepID=A0AAV8WQC5_9CUCU|nr:hypothetical protein NQ314_018949 [Rhamnusium bicolor]